MKRTIAAILAADVAGYSRLMAEDEEDTLARLAAAKRVFREAVDGASGRVFNTAGDAILAEFPSAVEALRAALAIQGALNDLDRDDPPGRRVRFRMGLTIGDVVEVEGDLLGDGVNIAARLEGLAEPGGICLSRTLHEAVSGKVPVRFRDIGAQKLKNIPRPVHAFRVVMPDDPARAAAARPRRTLIARWGAPAAALLVAAGLAGLWRAGLLDRGGEPALADPARDDTISVSVTRARNVCFADQIRLTGRLAPRRTVDVSPDGEGLRVVRALAKPLDAVQSGQVLAELQRAGDPDQRRVALRSPTAGLVLAASTVADAPASPTAAPLFQIAAQGAFELEAEAPVAMLGRLAPGQGASVTPLGGTAQAGRVRSVADGVDPAMQLGRVRILLNAEVGAGTGLRAGQLASAVVRIGERCGVAAPFSAIAQEAEGPVVYVANGRRIEARPVVTGLVAGRDVEIRSGLDERDTIVARAGAFLREGDLIRPVALAPDPR